MPAVAANAPSNSWTELTQVSPRSPRVAVVFLDDQHAWGPERPPNSLGSTFHRVIEWMGRLWGGKYMIALPVVDGSIPQVFVDLARAYDPDLLLQWQWTLSEIELRDPAQGAGLGGGHEDVEGANVPRAHDRRSNTTIVARKAQTHRAYNETFQNLHDMLNPFLLEQEPRYAHHLQTELPRPLTALSSLKPWELELGQVASS